MIPTVEQVKQFLFDVAALKDPEVRPASGGAFGSPSDPGTPHADPEGIEVDVVTRGDELVYRVTRWWPAPKSQNPDPVIRVGGMCRWIYAKPAWGCAADLPDLATAVRMQRLPGDAFPKPGEEVWVLGVDIAYTPSGVHYLDTGEVVVGVKMPLWRLLVSMGRL